MPDDLTIGFNPSFFDGSALASETGLNTVGFEEPEIIEEIVIECN